MGREAIAENKAHCISGWMMRVLWLLALAGLKRLSAKIPQLTYIRKFGSATLHGRQAAVVIAALSILMLLSACAVQGGSALKSGTATLPEVLAAMGEPVMRWRADDGGEQLVYPRGPAGTQTFMVFIGADGRLQRIEGVLDVAHFARIEPGRSDKTAVLRLLGPSQPQWTVYFPARDELVWEWRFCDEGSKLARFDVLFDATSGIVRSSYQRPDYMGPDGIVPFCGH